jgi:hypothetical protein
MDAKENTSLLALKKQLEELNVFKRLGTYYFWDVEEYCNIDNDFENLNSTKDCIHLILAKSNFEVVSNKRPRLSSVGKSMGIGNDVGDNV